jgi:hypothetical protein
MMPRYHPETMRLNKVISWQAKKKKKEKRDKIANQSTIVD